MWLTALIETISTPRGLDYHSGSAGPLINMFGWSEHVVYPPNGHVVGNIILNICLNHQIVGCVREFFRQTHVPLWKAPFLMDHGLFNPAVLYILVPQGRFTMRSPNPHWACGGSSKKLMVLWANPPVYKKHQKTSGESPLLRRNQLNGPWQTDANCKRWGKLTKNVRDLIPKNV